MTDSHHLRILVVDDDAAFARYLVRVVEMEPDFQVVGCASSLSEATSAADDIAPDVVLTDYRLPDGTGAGLARHVHSALSEVRVIVLTAAPSPAIRRDVAAAQAWALMDKVVLPRRLTDAIRDAGLDVNSSLRR
jgi:DNA-binding NarL/FixJ family response regulator